MRRFLTRLAGHLVEGMPVSARTRTYMAHVVEYFREHLEREEAELFPVLDGLLGSLAPDEALRLLGLIAPADAFKADDRVEEAWASHAGTE